MVLCRNTKKIKRNLLFVLTLYLISALAGLAVNCLELVLPYNFYKRLPVRAAYHRRRRKLVLAHGVYYKTENKIYNQQIKSYFKRMKQRVDKIKPYLTFMYLISALAGLAVNCLELVLPYNFYF